MYAASEVWARHKSSTLSESDKAEERNKNKQTKKTSKIYAVSCKKGNRAWCRTNVISNTETYMENYLETSAWTTPEGPALMVS